MANQDWLPEQLKTLLNLTLVAQLLIKEGKRELLNTILELIFIEAQDILDSQCVVKQ